MQLTILIVVWAVVLLELFTGLRATRWVFREVIRLFILAELMSLRIVRLVIPPKFVVLGRCHMRGNCCTMIVANPPSFIKDRPALLACFAAYHRVMHNFHVVNRGPDRELIFKCHHLRDDGRCGIYRHRPFICRNYPVLPWFEAPKPLPGCGYQVAPRVVAKMKSRPSLPILNPVVALHHPTRPGGRHREELPEDFHPVDITR